MALIVFASGCVPPVPERPGAAPPALELLESGDLPAFADDMDYDGLAEAIRQSLTYCDRVPDDRRFRFGATAIDKARMVRSLELFRDFIAGRPDRDQLNRFIRERYQVYRSVGRPPDDDVLFTGYFEPLYPGSLTPAPGYSIPVYGLPEDLVTVKLGDFSPEWAGKRLVGRVAEHRLVPYYTRAEIQQDGVLNTKAPIIAWMRDPVDLYFIQVQGSGRIRTPDGQRISILYAAQNGHPADLVGRHLVRENKVPLEEMSMQRIRRYFQEHPEDVAPMLQQDPSFVFFRIGGHRPSRQPGGRGDPRTQHRHRPPFISGRGPGVHRHPQAACGRESTRSVNGRP